MDLFKIDYSQVSEISKKDLAYIELQPFLKDFYKYTPSIESFKQAINDRKKYPVNRNVLVDSLKADYSTISPTNLQSSNIDLLKEDNSFTIITAHQPSLLGGPLYYIFKICSVINLCKQLKESYPEQNFVPVFISGGEDHDFEEINHLQLFGKRIEWEKEASGPVGRLDVEGLDDVITHAEEILGDNEDAKQIIKSFKDALSGASNYSDFVFKWVNELFGKYGVLVVRMDKHAYKKELIPIFKKEITEQFSQPFVVDTQNKLEQHNFKNQAYAREINLFYLGDGGRLRIEKDGDKYIIVDGTSVFNEEELLNELEAKPENFSPNVIMRPLMQEVCLPNLAYVGGGGEIAYWLERKSQFEAVGVFFPMLIRRNSAMILDGSSQKQLKNLDFTIEDIFKEEDALIRDYIEAHSEVDISLEESKHSIEKSFETIAAKSKEVDPTLEKSVLAEMTKVLKNIDHMESRIRRSIKAKEEVHVNRIKKLKDKLFPGHGLQERKDNFMEFYGRHGNEWITELTEVMNPLDRQFYILAL